MNNLLRTKVKPPAPPKMIADSPRPDIYVVMQINLFCVKGLIIYVADPKPQSPILRWNGGFATLGRQFT